MNIYNYNTNMPSSGLFRTCFNDVKCLAYKQFLTSMCIVLAIFVFAVTVTKFEKSGIFEQSEIVGQDSPPVVRHDFRPDVDQDVHSVAGQEIPLVVGEDFSTIVGYDFTQVVEQDVQPVFVEDNMTQSVIDIHGFPPGQSFSQDVGHDFTQVVDQDVPPDVGQDFPPIVDLDFPSYVGQDFPSDVVQDFPSDVGQDFPSDVDQVFPSVVGQDFPSDVGQDFPPVVGQDFPSDVVQDFPSDVSQDFPQDVDQYFTQVLGQKTEKEEADISIRKIKKNVGQTFPSVVVGRKREKDETDQSIVKIDKRVRKDFTQRGLDKIQDLGRYDLLEQRGCKKRLPHALIIGIMKGGTEAFSTFLALNTKVAMSLNARTTWYFTSNYHRGPAWYRDQMLCSTKEQITIEKAPQYMPAPSAPLRVYRMNPAMKLIVLVRDPIARAVSHYLQMQQANPNKLRGHTLEQHLFHPDGSVNSESPLISRSRYASMLQYWLQYFDKKQIHIVDGDRFKDHQVDVLAETEDFLGIEHQITADRFIFNNEKGFYCLKSLHGEEICLGSGKGRTHPTLKDSDYRKLREYFRPHNEKFFQQFNKRYNW